MTVFCGNHWKSLFFSNCSLTETGHQTLFQGTMFEAQHLTEFWLHEILSSPRSKNLPWNCSFLLVILFWVLIPYWGTYIGGLKGLWENFNI